MPLIAFRLANYETPLWTVPNFSAGRYNRTGSGPTQYLSLHPMTPWAELLRAEDRRTRARAMMLHHPLWAVKVGLAREPMELDFDTAEAFGLAPEDLVSDDHSVCQSLAEGLRNGEGEPRPLIAPSAALAGTRNLVLLAPAVVTSYEAEPVGPEDLPTSMASQDCRCPEGLWDLVHYRGAETPHRAYAAWREGEEHRFEEPPVVLDEVVP